MTENTKRIIKFLQEHKDQKYTASDLESALGISKKSIDGSFTMAISTKNLGYRLPMQIKGPDGDFINVKYLILNDAGMALNVD